MPTQTNLAHRTREELERTGMQLALEHEAVRIDPLARTVHSRTSMGDSSELSYDRLVVATGAEPIRPPLYGLDMPGVHVLHTMDHALELQNALSDSHTRSAIIVGAGYIGPELAEALVHRGIQVTLVEQVPRCCRQSTRRWARGCVRRSSAAGRTCERGRRSRRSSRPPTASGRRRAR